MKKKVLSIITMVLVAVLSLFTLAGCESILKAIVNQFSSKDISEEFISDGDFKYYDEGDYYTIVGLTETGMEQEDLYIPPYYRDKPVRYTVAPHKNGIYFEEDYYTYRIENVTTKKAYFPYTHELRQDEYWEFGKWRKHNDENYYWNDTWIYITNLSYMQSVYYILIRSYACPPKTIVPVPGLEILKAENRKKYEDAIENDYQFVQYAGNIIQAANTAYMFNYEGAPNEGYFFVNDFERGGLIEDTPYVPRRDGYTFVGWYKEEDCINEWDFGVDTLPVAQYDEEENFIFQETRLYAKWSVNQTEGE